MHVSQDAFARDVVHRFEMRNANATSTLRSTSVKLAKAGDAGEVKFDYGGAVGALMYLSMMTRPDIAEAVNACASFVHNPTSAHVIAVKRILRYVKGTMEHGIIFERSPKFGGVLRH